MSSTREYLDNTRQAYGPLFVVAPIEGGTEILFKGALLMSIERDERLPPGFYDRMVAHIMDLLTGRRSALWDEQAIYGEKPLNLEDVRARAGAAADDDARRREGYEKNDLGAWYLLADHQHEEDFVCETCGFGLAVA